MIAQLVRAGVLYTSGPRFKSWSPYHDSVVELAYTTDLKSVDHIGLAGSSPATVTIKEDCCVTSGSLWSSITGYLSMYSNCLFYALVAQLVEQSAFNRLVQGSSPCEGTIQLRSKYYEVHTTKSS